MCGFPTKVALILVSCLLMWFGYRGIQDGRVKEDGNQLIEREESPINYWVTEVIYIGGGIAGILVALFL